VVLGVIKSNEMKITAKILTTLITILFSKTIFAQLPINEETGQVEYTEVIKLPEMNKKQIYDKAKLWIVSTLKSGDNMVELNGTNSDQIVGTGNIAIDSIHRGQGYGKNAYMIEPLNFKFLVFCKDGKLKYSVENFTFGSYNLIGSFYLKGSKAYKEKNDANIKSRVHKNIQSLIEDFKRQMKKRESDDW